VVRAQPPGPWERAPGQRRRSQPLDLGLHPSLRCPAGPGRLLARPGQRPAGGPSRWSGMARDTGLQPDPDAGGSAGASPGPIPGAGPGRAALRAFLSAEWRRGGAARECPPAGIRSVR
jgi:hypothetical protein